MLRHFSALAAKSDSVSGTNLTWVVIVAVVALLALAFSADRHTLTMIVGNSTVTRLNVTGPARSPASPPAPGKTPSTSWAGLASPSTRAPDTRTATRSAPSSGRWNHRNAAQSRCAPRTSQHYRHPNRIDGLQCCLPIA